MTFAEAGITLLDCDHKTPAAQQSGRPYVGIPQITTGRVDFASARKISEADFITWTRKTKYQKDDVILSRRTNPGVTAVDDTGTEFALGQNLVLLRADGTKVFPPFLRWIVHSPAWWVEIEKYLNVGAVFSSLRCGDVPKFEFSFPPTWEQEDIARILRALDDKIELNRRMNETLEAMARAVFRDWFVDFGPTRRKAAGITDPAAILGGLLPDPEKAAPLVALFPDSFGDNGLPEGWEERPFVGFLDIIGGGTPKTKVPEYWGGKVPWFSVVDTPPTGGVFVWNTEKTITERGVAESSVRMIDAGTTIISARGTVGNIAMAARPMTFNQSCYALRAVEPVGDIFVYLATERMVERLKAMAHGSVFSTITRATFESLNFAWAGEDVFTAFERLIEPMFELIKANGQENQTLAATRDLLLPKLMSGDLRLTGAEDVV
ncbi:hypothetical protein CKO11_00040 [Rhodobacter sp. TJ_12]|nr:hypothetical protein [Rhodobacter sp. TJ_12]